MQWAERMECLSFVEDPNLGLTYGRDARMVNCGRSTWITRTMLTFAPSFP